MIGCQCPRLTKSLASCKVGDDWLHTLVTQDRDRELDASIGYRLPRMPGLHVGHGRLHFEDTIIAKKRRKA